MIFFIITLGKNTNNQGLLFKKMKSSIFNLILTAPITN